jgi:hypothetical protein
MALHAAGFTKPDHWRLKPNKNRLVATLGQVCASQLGHRSQGSDSAGGFPTSAVYRAGPGRSPRCMSCTTGKRASLGRDLWQFGWSDLRHLRVCGSAGRNQLDYAAPSTRGPSRWHWFV